MKTKKHGPEQVDQDRAIDGLKGDPDAAVQHSSEPNKYGLRDRVRSSDYETAAQISQNT